MQILAIVWCVFLGSIAACTDDHGQSKIAVIEKIEGPNIKSLSHNELMAILHECHQFGASDDPRVKYTTSYCSSIQSAHAMEGYRQNSPARVDGSITRIH